VIGVGIAFIVLGLVFLFVIPWVGIVAGIVGLVLAVLWLAGLARGVFGHDERAESRGI